MPRSKRRAAVERPAMPAPIITTRGSGKDRSTLIGSTAFMPRSIMLGEQSYTVAGFLGHLNVFFAFLSDFL